MGKRKPEPYAPSILVADDDAQLRTLFRRILEEAGYFVTEAAAGRIAVSAARERFFDVLITDLSMPDIDGFELISMIRSELPGIKVLVVSGYMSGGLLPLAGKLAATAWLDKLLAPGLLLPVVGRLIAGG